MSKSLIDKIKAHILEDERNKEAKKNEELLAKLEKDQKLLLVELDERMKGLLSRTEDFEKLIIPQTEVEVCYSNFTYAVASLGFNIRKFPTNYVTI